ncbi:Hint domain-containing protein [Thalassococcus sp. S3]|uniref:Hint domain-containing protein n=1 Tax=Thalassococcus sp. S3 TaxID=2017482 RepID=UPI0010244E61|nr:Hint domain-containing protein [Thalassococcus sp. S3]QBF30872.1 hemolysin-type calcium-binding protein [Thalassococcus sp. S3]
MKTGFRGTFVISWSQTEIDGLAAAPQSAIEAGATWSWQGEPLRVDGPNSVLHLERADQDSQLRRRAARMVRRLVGAALDDTSHLVDVDVEIDDAVPESGFVVTDGRLSYTITVIETGPQSQPLLMFLDAIPPRGVDLWVVHHALREPLAGPGDPASGGVICFTPGARISTPGGSCAVEDLQVGDRVMTRDNGPQEVMWIGSRRMTGARLFAMPHLRPIRLRPGALGIERPDQELLVSPEHRMLVRGAAARDLFNSDEVLVPARDLVNGSTISVDLTLPEVTYVHLLLPSHQIVWANGVEAESFHPANTALTTLDVTDRQRLLRIFPEFETDPHLYGSYARRNLSRPEAALLMHKAA